MEQISESEKQQSASKEQALCSSCGLCCDGSIFDRVVIKPADDEASLVRGGFVLAQRGAQRVFLQPCHHLHDRKCDIYFSWRPQTCHGFRCKLLKQVGINILSLGQALEVVEKARQHAAELRRQLQVACSAKLMSISEMFDIWESQQESPDQAVVLNFSAFKFRLSRDFGKYKKGEVEKGDNVKPKFMGL